MSGILHSSLFGPQTSFCGKLRNAMQADEFCRSNLAFIKFKEAGLDYRKTVPQEASVHYTFGIYIFWALYTSIKSPLILLDSNAYWPSSYII